MNSGSNPITVEMFTVILHTYHKSLVTQEKVTQLSETRNRMKKAANHP